ncbi:hypothetical protein BGZ63DRAFT_139048 [Mariannaea sp. PMI_226]|nr:hypothetical protein BGZ63DRAFT_139048 [Mariannaea sp. PMI_226]
MSPIIRSGHPFRSQHPTRGNRRQRYSLLKHALVNSCKGKGLGSDSIPINNKVPGVRTVPSDEVRRVERRRCRGFLPDASNEEDLNTTNNGIGTKSIVPVPTPYNLHQIGNFGNYYITDVPRERIGQVLQNQQRKQTGRVGKNIKLVYSVFVTPDRNTKWSPKKRHLSKYKFMQLLGELDIRMPFNGLNFKLQIKNVMNFGRHTNR